jgi:hypothetical protein
VDGVSWQQYEHNLEESLISLHQRTSGGWGKGLLAEDLSIRRLLNQQLRKGNTSSYENHYATLPGALTTPDRRNLLHSMVCLIFLLYVEGRMRQEAFVQLPICFLPKSRASIDQAPGPIMANVAPSAARMIATDSSPAPVKVIHT